jgi:hypothetical protein
MTKETQPGHRDNLKVDGGGVRLDMVGGGGGGTSASSNRQRRARGREQAALAVSSRPCGPLGLLLIDGKVAAKRINGSGKAD